MAGVGKIIMHAAFMVLDLAAWTCSFGADCISHCIRKLDGEKMNIVCVSGGKDSTAMLFTMKERGIPTDKIIFFDTGKEYPAMYDHIQKVEDYIKQPIERIEQEHSFEYWMLERIRQKGPRKGTQGYGWPNFLNRWCTSYFKRNPLKRIKREYPGSTIFQGIAIDEKERATKNKDITNIKYPLVDWKMTEKDCLELCYSLGFTWDGLYELFSRVSCWCCPLKKKKDYETLKKHFPEYFCLMQDWNLKVDRPLRHLKDKK